MASQIKKCPQLIKQAADKIKYNIAFGNPAIMTSLEMLDPWLCVRSFRMRLPLSAL
jgi:hypothetical protein